MSADQTETKNGISYSDFVSGVDVLVTMRAQGELTVTVTRLRGLRLVVSNDLLRERFSAKLAREVSDDEVRLMRREVGDVAFASIVADTPLDQYRTYIMLKGRPPKAEEPEEEFVKKAKYATKALVTQSLRDRFRRIEEALSPVLEDVSVELVSKREEPNANDLGGVAYLRLTYHVAVPDPAASVFPFLRPSMFFGSSKYSVFSIECDEHDLDLMIRRLNRAKDMLAKAIPQEPAHGT